MMSEQGDMIIYTQQQVELDDELMEDEDDPNEPTIIIADNNASSTDKGVNHISEDQLYSIYQSFDINFEEITKKFSSIRLNVIHIRGVQDMSSDDVLEYFFQYDPSSIEWVNDLSCNVLFDDAKASGWAMLRLTTALVMKKNGSSSADVNQDIDYGIEVINADSLEVPVPPGRWRLGKAHPKSKALLLRFATNNDKKIPGARQMSQFYAKHGVPKDLPKNSNVFIPPKRKLSDDEYSDGEISDEGEVMVNRKRMKMRMRADEEEDKKRFGIKTKKIPLEERLGFHEKEVELNVQKKSIWERLDNDEQGNYCSVDPSLMEVSVVRQEVLPVNPVVVPESSTSTKLNKKNVWNRLEIMQANPRVKLVPPSVSPTHVTLKSQLSLATIEKHLQINSQSTSRSVKIKSDVNDLRNDLRGDSRSDLRSKLTRRKSR